MLQLAYNEFQETENKVRYIKSINQQKSFKRDLKENKFSIYLAIAAIATTKIKNTNKLLLSASCIYNTDYCHSLQEIGIPDLEDKVESESSTKSLEFKSSSEDSEKKLEVKFNIFLDFGVLVAMNVDIPVVDGLGVDGPVYNTNSRNSVAFQLENSSKLLDLAGESHTIVSKITFFVTTFWLSILNRIPLFIEFVISSQKSVKNSLLSNDDTDVCSIVLASLERTVLKD
ncbi:hypothetical protein QTP88_028599 [Uroleucon formosanum]